jgi:hypothetical protein
MFFIGMLTRGFRVLAVSILLLEGQNIQVYGSMNVGLRVLNEDENFSEYAKEAQELILKSHKVKDNVLHTTVDCEDHLGKDGRYYIHGKDNLAVQILNLFQLDFA